MSKTEPKQGTAKGGLSAACLADLKAIAIPRHARWDPMGLMTVRSYVRNQLSDLGDLEEHHFTGGTTASTSSSSFLAATPIVGRFWLVPTTVHSSRLGLTTMPVASAASCQALVEHSPKRPIWIVADQEGRGCRAALAEQLRMPATN